MVMRRAASARLACDESVVEAAVQELNRWFGGGSTNWEMWRNRLLPATEIRFPGVLDGCFVR